MKNGVLIVILITALAVLAPFAQGLSCYTCSAGGGTNFIGQNPLGLEDHKDCVNGPLPKSILKTCTGGIQERGKPDYAYFCNSIRQVNPENITEMSRFCSWDSQNTLLRCSDAETISLNRHFPYRVCKCDTDKCNNDFLVSTSPGSLRPSILILMVLLTGFKILKI